MADPTTATASSASAATLTTPAAQRTIREILGLHDLLVFLGDGHVELIRDEDGKLLLDANGNAQRGKVTPFVLGIKGRYAVLKSRTATDKVVKRVQQLRDDLIKERATGGGQSIAKEDPQYDVKVKEVQTELDKLLDSTETLNLHVIPIEDLKLDVNSLITDSIVLALGDLVSAPAA